VGGRVAEFEHEHLTKSAEVQPQHNQEIADFRQHRGEPATLMAFTKPFGQVMLLRRK
jgi:hypothetical protein